VVGRHDGDEVDPLALGAGRLSLRHLLVTGVYPLRIEEEIFTAGAGLLRVGGKGASHEFGLAVERGADLELAAEGGVDLALPGWPAAAAGAPDPPPWRVRAQALAVRLAEPARGAPGLAQVEGLHAAGAPVALERADGVTRLGADAIRYAADGSVRIEAIGGQDSEQVSGSPYGNSKAGGRLSLDTRLGGAWIRGSIGVLSSDFDGLFFGTPREDTQASGVLEVEFRDAFVDGLSIIPTVRYIDNDSDVDLYEYNRAEFGIRLRWAPR